MTSYGDHPGPLAVAHRGGMALAPENTLAAFGRATSLGLTHLETDVRTTRDGHVVCFHDPTLRRVTGHPGRVADLDLADLRRLRVGGTDRVPTLTEAMATFPDARFAIDLKDEAAIGATARLLRANPGWARRVLVAGAWSRWLDRLRAEAPGVTTALGWRSLTTLVACSRGGVRPPGRVVVRRAGSPASKGAAGLRRSTSGSRGAGGCWSRRRRWRRPSRHRRASG